MIFLHHPDFPENIRHFYAPHETIEDNQTQSRIDVTLDQLEFARGRIGRVYRGSIIQAGLPPERLRVVVKLVAPYAKLPSSTGSHIYTYHSTQRTAEVAPILIQDLAHEAAFYLNRLATLQGVVVPRYFGHGVSEDARAACLILEDAGKVLEFPYRRLPQEDRRQLFEHQVALHRAGVSHGDVARRNFVKSAGGHIRLIDFDRAVEHECHLFSENDAAGKEPCVQLDKIRKWFGQCPTEELSRKEAASFEPWDGIPWGC